MSTWFEAVMTVLSLWIAIAAGSIAVDLDTIVKMYKGEEKK